MLIYSPNMLKTYNVCPKKFYYKYVEHINIPCFTTPFDKGKKIHALANYYLQGVNISRIETALNSEEKQAWQTLLENPFMGKKCFNSEYSLSCKINDYWIGGRLDAVVYDNKDFYILDYKTGMTPKNPEFDYQTMVYLLCMDRILKDYNSLSFVYISIKEKKNHVIKFSPELKTEYEKQIKDICTKITKDKIYKETCDNCQYCEYKSLCL